MTISQGRLREMTDYANTRGVEFAKHLISRGMTRVAAASIAGNIFQENEGKPGLNMLEMRGPRLSKMNKFTGGGFGNQKGQLDFFVAELTNPKVGSPTETGPGKRLLNATNVTEAQAAMKGYVRYARGREDVRIGTAQMVLDKLNGVDPDPKMLAELRERGAPAVAAKNVATRTAAAQAGDVIKPLQELVNAVGRSVDDTSKRFSVGAKGSDGRIGNDSTAAIKAAHEALANPEQRKYIAKKLSISESVLEKFGDGLGKIAGQLEGQGKNSWQAKNETVRKGADQLGLSPSDMETVAKFSAASQKMRVTDVSLGSMTKKPEAVRQDFPKPSLSAVNRFAEHPKV